MTNIIPLSIRLVGLGLWLASWSAPSAASFPPPNPIAEEDYAQFLHFDRNPGVHLLQTGTFHGEDLLPGTRERRWSGLYFRDGKSSLRPVSPQFTPAFDPLLDAEGEKSAVKIAVQDEEGLVALVGGIEPAAASPTTLPVYADDGSAVEFPLHLAPGRSLTAGDGFVLKAYGERNGEYALEITREDGSKYSQFFAGAYAFDDAQMQVLWIGDINGDEQPDVLLNISHKYSYSHLALYLSVPDDVRILVPVADFRFTAC